MKHRYANKLLSILLTLCMILGLVPWTVLPARATEQFLTADAYANQWARSDVRAWLNGLEKNNGTLPVDGAYGTKADGSFLSCFTYEELALFRPRNVTTVTFNDGLGEADERLWGSTGEVVTRDLFWLPSGNLMRYGQTIYEDQVISADPSYDLGDYYTTQQKLVNDGGNGWKNMIPIPYWCGSGAIYDAFWLRSASYEENGEVLAADSGYNIEAHDVDDSWAYPAACAAIELPSGCFAAYAAVPSTPNASFAAAGIAAYEKLGVKDPSKSAPSWGMYLKEIKLDAIGGSLTHDEENRKLTFTATATLPQGKYLMAQAYKAWDTNMSPTENARAECTVYCAAKWIENENTQVVEFTNVPNDAEDYTIKIWVEDGDGPSPAQASAPLTFAFDGNGTVNAVSETKSGNPRVFAYKADLACAWGTLALDKIWDGSYYDAHFCFAGNDATWQKLYIGSANGKPIEWWIVSRDGSALTLYQASKSADRTFNESAASYEGNAKNPSLALAESLTVDDLSDIAAKVTLSCGGEELNAPAEEFSVQYCKAENGKVTGTAWTEAPDGPGEYLVRAVFAGAPINDVAYTRCYSNARSVTLPAVAQIEDELGSVSFYDLQDALDACTDAKTVTLLADVTTDAELTFSAIGTLDLNGHTLGAKTTSISVIKAEGTLTLKDSGSGGKIDGGRNSATVGVLVEEGGALTMEGGTITACASGVYVEGCFELSGGAITACAVGVEIRGGTFTMSDGAITGCENTGADSESAAGVTINGGTFAMSGGEISSCVSNDGAVGFFLDWSDIDKTQAFEVSGDARITGNTDENGAPCNIKLYSFDIEAYGQRYRAHHTVTVTDALTENAALGVTLTGYEFVGDDVEETPTAGEFARGSGSRSLTAGDVSRFASDVSDYVAGLNADGKAVLGVKRTVTFKANGGTGSDVTQKFPNGLAAALDANTFTRAGYTFAGWNTQADGKGTPYADKASVTLTADTTLYAQWTEITYAVTVNGGTGSGDYAAGATVTITANAPDAGKVFDKWTSEDGVTFADAASATTTFTMPAKAVTVTAAYKNATYAVTLNANGGNIVSGSVTSYTFGTETALPANVTRDGYAFGGWYDNAGFTGSPVTAIGAAETGNRTFYAKWTLVPSLTGGKVTAPKGAVLILASYDANGRMTSVQSKTLTEDCVNKSLPELGLTVPDGAYKLMLVDGTTYAPLCAAWTYDPRR